MSGDYNRAQLSDIMIHGDETMDTEVRPQHYLSCSSFARKRTLLSFFCRRLGLVHAVALALTVTYPAAAGTPLATSTNALASHICRNTLPSERG